MEWVLKVAHHEFTLEQQVANAAVDRLIHANAANNANAASSQPAQNEAALLG